MRHAIVLIFTFRVSPTPAVFFNEHGFVFQAQFYKPFFFCYVLLCDGSFSESNLSTNAPHWVPRQVAGNGMPLVMLRGRLRNRWGTRGAARNLEQPYVLDQTCSNENGHFLQGKCWRDVVTYTFFLVPEFIYCIRMPVTRSPSVSWALKPPDRLILPSKARRDKANFEALHSECWEKRWWAGCFFENGKLCCLQA